MLNLVCFLFVFAVGLQIVVQATVATDSAIKFDTANDKVFHTYKSAPHEPYKGKSKSHAPGNPGHPTKNPLKRESKSKSRTATPSKPPTIGPTILNNDPDGDGDIDVAGEEDIDVFFNANTTNWRQLKTSL